MERAKLVNLVSGVIDIELSGHIRAAGGEDGGQRIAQHAAPGVAHVHGAGGVCGDEFDVYLLAPAVVGAAVGVALLEDILNYAGVEAAAEIEIEEAAPATSHLSKKVSQSSILSMRGLSYLGGGRSADPSPKPWRRLRNNRRNPCWRALPR